jgi:hypothetical protein
VESDSGGSNDERRSNNSASEVLNARVGQMLRYMNRLRQRMHKRKFPESDDLMRAVRGRVQRAPSSQRASALLDGGEWRGKSTTGAVSRSGSIGCAGRQDLFIDGNDIDGFID